jgi:hypothetical protein
MNQDVEAGLMAVLVGGGIALSLGLAFGVLRVTMQAMSTAGVPAMSNTQLAAGSRDPLPR